MSAPVPAPAPVALPTLPSLPTSVVGATDMASKYEMLEQIGSGTYGYVFRARVRGTDKMVALKRIKMDDPRPDAQRDGVRFCNKSLLFFNVFPFSCLLLLPLNL